MAQKEITSFQQAVYNSTRMIPRGRVSTYGAIAKFLGKPRAARAVGNALHNNPFAPEVPCHRVVMSDGRLGGFAEGVKKKIEILKKEGVVCRDGRVVDWPDKFFPFR
ncbi:MAG: MGMT family protein [Patescibacteria group bacterium]|nr:MGMT family protein [Patescibacteria group bacterium]